MLFELVESKGRSLTGQVRRDEKNTELLKTVSSFWAMWVLWDRHVFRGKWGRMVKNLPANAGDIRDPGLIPRSGRSPGGGRAADSSILAWEIPWTEQPGKLQSMGSQRLGRDWSDLAGKHEWGFSIARRKSRRLNRAAHRTRHPRLISTLHGPYTGTAAVSQQILIKALP